MRALLGSLNAVGAALSLPGQEGGEGERYALHPWCHKDTGHLPPGQNSSQSSMTLESKLCSPQWVPLRAGRPGPCPPGGLRGSGLRTGPTLQTSRVWEDWSQGEGCTQNREARGLGIASSHSCPLICGITFGLPKRRTWRQGYDWRDGMVLPIGFNRFPVRMSQPGTPDPEPLWGPAASVETQALPPTPSYPICVSIVFLPPYLGCHL